MPRTNTLCSGPSATPYCNFIPALLGWSIRKLFARAYNDPLIVNDPVTTAFPTTSSLAFGVVVPIPRLVPSSYKKLLDEIAFAPEILTSRLVPEMVNAAPLDPLDPVDPLVPLEPVDPLVPLLPLVPLEPLVPVVPLVPLALNA